MNLKQLGDNLYKYSQKLFNKIYKSKIPLRKDIILDIILILLVVALSVWAGKGVFKYNIYYTHDFDHHIARSYDAIKTIMEGHFPLRWAGSLNYFCGVPIFNFFYPLLYYLVIILEFVTNRVIFPLKLISFLTLPVSAVFFYLWMKEEVKDKVASFTASMLYLFAPYRFSLIFVRGSPEYLAYAIFPIYLFLFSLLFKSEDNKRYFLAFITSLLGGLLTISHNFSVMFMMPIVLGYLIFKLYSQKIKIIGKQSLFLFITFISSFGMGAFFIGPALLEEKFTKIGKVDIVKYTEHFPEFWQLIRSKWGYFYSAPGTVNDGMSFMLGYSQWVLLGFVLIFLVYQLYKNRKHIEFYFSKNLWLIILFVLSTFTIFMMLPNSDPIWQAVPIIQQIQFPWRLLGIAVFFISALSGYFLVRLKGIIYWIIILFLITLAIIGNRNNLLPQPITAEEIYRYSDFEKLHYNRYTTTTLGDDIVYVDAPEACYFTTPLVSDSSGNIIKGELINSGNTYGLLKFTLDKSKITAKNIIFRLGYFPGAYKLNINGSQETSYNECLGRVCLDQASLRDGENFISWQIVQTPIEKIFNVVTVAFLIGWILFLIINRLDNQTKKRLLKYIPVLVVFAIFLILRFYNLDKRVLFGWDQERDAWAIKELLSGKLTLIGPRVLGPEGFFLPPYFFYLLTPFYFIFKQNPSGMLGFLIFYNILFFITAYFLLKKIFDLRTSFVFLFIWAVISAAISIDTIAWNPLLIPLFFIALIFSLWKFKNNMQFLIFGLLLGLGISFHVQFLLLSPLVLPFLANPIKNIWKSLKNIGLVVFGSLIPFIPLFIFDLRHGFINLKQILLFAEVTKEKDFLAFLPVWRNFVSFISSLNVGLFISVIFFFFIISILYFLQKREEEREKRKILIGLLLSWLFFPIGFAFYGQRPSEYYFIYLITIIVLSISLFISKLWKEGKVKTGILILGALVLILLQYPFKILKNNSNSLYYKREAVKFLSVVTDQKDKFNISFDTLPNEDTGFRYLINYYKVPFTNNPQDTLFEITVPAARKTDAFVFGNMGVYIPKSWLENNWVGK